MELRNTLQRQLSVDLPTTLTFDYPTVSALAGFLASQALLASAGGNATPGTGASQPGPGAQAASVMQVRCGLRDPSHAMELGGSWLLSCHQHGHLTSTSTHNMISSSCAARHCHHCCPAAHVVCGSCRRS